MHPTTTVSAVKTVLVVENDPVSLDLYAKRLEREGFHTQTAEDGLSAMRVLSGTTPDLVVLDLMLPKFSGNDVFKYMRMDSRLKHVPVVIFSNASISEWPKDIDRETTRCLHKSDSTFDTLISSIHELLTPRTNGVESNGSEEAPRPRHSLIIVEPADRIPSQPRSQDDFVRETLGEIPSLRELSRSYIKAPESENGRKSLLQLHQRIRALNAGIVETGCNRLAMLTGNFDALLGELAAKPSHATPSILHTIAQAVDCMGSILEEGRAEFESALPQARVLTVDDDNVCNHVVVSTLKRSRFEVTSLDRPSAAIDAASSTAFDVILLDVNMPEMNGFQLCGKLRELSHCRTTPIIFITAHNNFENRKQSVLSGGHDFITKPISPWELALKVTIHLLHSQLRRLRDSHGQEPASPAPATESAPVNFDNFDMFVRKDAPASAAKPASYQVSPGTTESATNPMPPAQPVAPPEVPDIFLRSQPAEPPAPAAPPQSDDFVPQEEPVPAGSGLPDSPDPEFIVMGEHASRAPQPFEPAPIQMLTAAPIEPQPVAAVEPEPLIAAAPEPVPVPQTVSPAPATKPRNPHQDMKQEPNELFDTLVLAVARIIFGDGQVSEINLRLVRMALERHNIHEMLKGKC